MIQIKNSKITQIGLPKSGKLSTGESVSGYHLLDAEILKSEGWLPIEDNPPEYNPLTEVLRHTGWDIQEYKVVKQYMVVDKPPTPNHFGKIRELEETLEILLGDEE